MPGWFDDLMHDLGGVTFPMGFFFYNDLPGVRADPSMVNGVFTPCTGQTVQHTVPVQVHRGIS